MSNVVSRNDLSPGSAPQDPGPLLRDLVRLYAAVQRQAVTECGVTAAQCHVLVALEPIRRATLAALAAELGLDKGWVSRTVDALVQQGLVEKRPGRRDRRTVELHLTAEGRRRAGFLNDTLNRQAARIFHRLPPDLRGEVHRGLGLLLSAVREDAAGTGTGHGPAGAAVPTVPLPAVLPAAAGDIPGIRALLEAAGLPTEGLEDGQVRVLAAHEGGRVVGSAGLELYGPAALLRSVAVAADLRKCGLGRNLVEEALRLARDEEVEAVYLLTETAPQFFSRLGFRAVTRDQVDPSILKSPEFTHLCPQSAQVMVRFLVE